jgi:primary-amine oxidase
VDFQFYIATGPGGISLHDVRYKGDRLIYELAMQEALSQYAGPDRAQTYQSYLDVTIGFKDFNLIPGFDCPSYATYAGAFCLFDFQKDFPINRHLSYGAYYHGTKNIAFMVRSLSTVGNYDYMTTYEFHYDGTINVIVRASGYIQASTLVDDEEAWEYGFRIRDDLSGSMHDHVLNFKLDLDVLGTKNSVFKTEFVPHSQVYDWSDGETINTMKVERSFVESEDDGRIRWAANSAASYAVVNKDKPNEFGEFPGFKIFQSTGAPTYLTAQNSSQYPGQINWASHNVYALQRHDSEPVSAHPAGGYGTDVAFVDFDDFFDGESLDQEDVVLYFNLGRIHP